MVEASESATGHGLVFLILQMPVGILYWFSLSFSSNYIFETITFGSFMPILAAKLLTVLVLLVLSIMAYSEKKPGLAGYTAILSLLAVVLGETLNDGSRHPFMVVIGKEGIPISSLCQLLHRDPNANGLRNSAVPNHKHPYVLGRALLRPFPQISGRTSIILYF